MTERVNEERVRRPRTRSEFGIILEREGKERNGSPVYKDERQDPLKQYIWLEDVDAYI